MKKYLIQVIYYQTYGNQKLLRPCDKSDTKGKVGEVIELSLINNAGLVVDLQLIPDEKLEGQVISIVTSQDNISQVTGAATLKAEEQEIAQMLDEC